MNLSDFATERRPLRASMLPLLVRCPLSAVLKIFTGEGESGPAADTGSAVHAAAKAFHTVAEGDVPASIEAMRAGVKDYPLADLDAAEHQFRLYAADPRNREAEVVLCEHSLTLKIPPAEDDPTQEAIVVTGTLDQVRREAGGQLRLCDIKTGRSGGVDLLHSHALQLAAYQLGACEVLGEQVHQAAVIRTKDYLAKPQGPVFWEAMWRLSDCREMLNSVRRIVASVRRRQVNIGPNQDDCRWCVGLANCLPLLRRSTEHDQTKAA